MSQAEFGRAGGWSAATISRWETGRAQPSRLALKIILAFAEERGVRYRPRPGHQASFPVPALSLRAAAPEPALPMRDSHAPNPDLLPVAPIVSIGARRPRWEAEVSLKLALGSSRPDSQPAPRSRVRTGLIAAGLGAVAGTGLALITTWPSPSRAVPAPAAVWPAPITLAQPLPRAAALRGPTPGLPTVAPTADAPLPPQPRLEGVMVVGESRTATFGTPTDAVSLAEGKWLGEWRVTRIHEDGVELRDHSGATRAIQVGDPIPTE